MAQKPTKAIAVQEEIAAAQATAGQKANARLCVRYIAQNNVVGVRELLGQPGVDIKKIARMNYSGEPVLKVAIERCHIEMLRILLGQGVRPLEGDKPFTWAAYYGPKEEGKVVKLMELLIQSGVIPKADTGLSEELDLTVKREWPKATKLLLDRGGNAQASVGYSKQWKGEMRRGTIPLLTSALNLNDIATSNVLLDHHADILMKDSFGLTPLDHSLSIVPGSSPVGIHGNLTITNLYLKKGLTPENADQVFEILDTKIKALEQLQCTTEEVTRNTDSVEWLLGRVKSEAANLAKLRKLTRIARASHPAPVAAAG